MFRKIIKDIKRAVKFNQKAVNGRNIKNSSFAAGVARGYIDVLWGMGHEAMISFRDDNGCERISYVRIDNVLLVYGGEFDRDGYKELLEK